MEKKKKEDKYYLPRDISCMYFNIFSKNTSYTLQ